jgi:hypothetical protein
MSSIINPHTPLAYLPPDLANLVQGFSYVTIATLSVRILPIPSTKETAWQFPFFRHMCGTGWCLCPTNIESSAEADSVCLPLLISCHGQWCNIRSSVCCSHLGTVLELWVIASAKPYSKVVIAHGQLLELIISLHWIVAPVADCQTLQYIIGSFFALALSSTSLLFFSRVRAVYGNSKIITVFFGLMWVSTVGLSFLTLVSVESKVSWSVLLTLNLPMWGQNSDLSRGTYPAHRSDK